MAIDYVIEYGCFPREQLGTDGIMNRLKGLQRAETIIELFRKNGDDRPPDQMGFDFTRSHPDGQEDTQTIVVQDLLNQAQQLKPLEPYCVDCPANILGKPFGCIHYIQYPISGDAESWLLNQLPIPTEPLVWLLLKQGIEQFDYDGESVKVLRETIDTYFEDRVAATRRLGEIRLDANQVFEMIFTVGAIQPNHAGILLLFFNAIPRDLEANEIMNITPAPANALEKHPFLLTQQEGEDRTITELKQFFFALYTAWRFSVPLLVDA